MWNKEKQREIDRLNARCIELAQQLRDSNFDNKQLKEIRLEVVKENTKIHKSYTKQSNLINSIIKELYSSIKTDKQKVDKIKELVDDYQSLN